MKREGLNHEWTRMDANVLEGMGGCVSVGLLGIGCFRFFGVVRVG